MPAHRMVHSFQPRQTYIVNVQNNISRPQPTNIGGGFGWAFLLPTMMMGLGSIFGAFRGTTSQVGQQLGTSQASPQKTNDEADAKKKAALDDLAKIFGCTVIEDGSEPGKYMVMQGTKTLLKGGDYYAARDAMLGIGDGNTPAEDPDDSKAADGSENLDGNKTTTENSDGTKTTDGSENSDGSKTTTENSDGSQKINGKGGPQEDIYAIEKKVGTTTYKVEKGNTWYGIVSAKYDISGLSGKQILELALKLAAANSGIENETDAMAAAHKGVYFKVGDVINLPDKLIVNGQEVPLKGDQSQKVEQQEYGFVSGGTFAKTTVEQVGDKWQLLKNGVLFKTFDTEAEAKAEKAKLEKNNS